MYGNSTIWEGFPAKKSIRKGLSYEQPKREYVYVVYVLTPREQKEH